MLPQFPALRELTPIDVVDSGFAHVGRCAELERLTCMHCRQTTDAATDHIGRLPRLREVHVAGSPRVTLDGTQVFPPHVRVKYST